MKLNLGCGKTYLPGYINIDAYDETVADKKLPVQNLPYNDNSIAEIQALHLIEHLGYHTGMYALAEWFRILKSNGTLILETPDINQAFKEFTSQNLEGKKHLLTWIYGVETPGMHHLLCPPKKLLHKMLSQTGFSTITITTIPNKKHHPTLRATCTKPENNTADQLITQLRKHLQQHNLRQTQNIIVADEQERLITSLQKQLHTYLKNPKETTLQHLIIHGCITSPQITHVLLKQCIKHHRFTKQHLTPYLNTTAHLTKIHYPDLLTHLITQSPITPGTQHHTYQTITHIARQHITKLLNKQITPTHQTHQYPHTNTHLFSEKTLEHHAAQHSYQAIKAFHQNKYTQAITHLQKALQHDRNHLLYYWNLARLYMITNNKTQAETYYQHTQTLLEKANHPHKKDIQKQLHNERKQFSAKKHNTPLIELKE